MSLSDKIFQNGEYNRKPQFVIDTKDVKTHIQNAQKNLKQEEHYCLTKLLVKFNQKKLTSQDIREARGNIKFKTDKIFLEEFALQDDGGGKE